VNPIDAGNFLLNKLTSYWNTAQGTFNSIKAAFGMNGSGGKSTVEIDGSASTVKTVKPADAGNFLDNKLTTLFDGATGKLNSIKAAFGKDGSGGKSTIDFDGMLALFNIRPADKAGEANTETFEANGKGEVKAGKSGSNWRITMNTPFTYHEGGTEKTLPAGGVRAEDFQLYSSAHPIESFRTEFAYIDTAVVRDLYAMKAYIDKISANSIVANSYVRADKCYYNTISAGTQISSPSYRLYVNDDIAYLQNCFSSCVPSMSNGKITLTFGKIGGGTVDTVPFDISATTWYKNAVAAARNTGRTDVYVHDITIDAGTSETYQLHYADPNTGHEMNTGKTFKVTASSSVVGGTIDIPTGGISRNSRNPSGTLLNAMKDRILLAIENKQYLMFKVNVLDGSTVLSTKTYYMNFTG
jgi:hypothetical protein